MSVKDKVLKNCSHTVLRLSNAGATIPLGRSAARCKGLSTTRAARSSPSGTVWTEDATPSSSHAGSSLRTTTPTATTSSACARVPATWHAAAGSGCSPARRAPPRRAASTYRLRASRSKGVICAAWPMWWLSTLRKTRRRAYSADERSHSEARARASRTAGGRPVGAAAAKHALCRQAAHALFPHCAARRLRPQVRGYRGRVRRQRYNGFRGCSVVESGAYAPRIGAHGQERSARSMAACRAVHARRRELRTLPQGFRGADTLGRDALRRDVQRLGGILRHRRRRAPRRHAADDGLRHLLRVPQGRRSAPVGGCRAGRRICSRDNDMRRAVAIRDRRRGKDYLPSNRTE